MKKISLLLLMVGIMTLGFTGLMAEDMTGEGVQIKWGEMFTSAIGFSILISFTLLIVIILSIIKFTQLYLKEKFNEKDFYLKLKGYIRNEQYDEATRIASNFKETTMGHIFWNGLLGFNEARKSGLKGRELKQALQNSFDEAGLQLIPKLEGMLSWFDILAQIATLLGLLGTIYGLVFSFAALEQAPEDQKQQLLTKGIGQAMGTTGMGLIVAIPTMLIKGFLQGRADRVVNNIDEYSIKTINQINHSIKE